MQQNVFSMMINGGSHTVNLTNQAGTNHKDILSVKNLTHYFQCDGSIRLF